MSTVKVRTPPPDQHVANTPPWWSYCYRNSTNSHHHSVRTNTQVTTSEASEASEAELQVVQDLYGCLGCLDRCPPRGALTSRHVTVGAEKAHAHTQEKAARRQSPSQTLDMAALHSSENGNFQMFGSGARDVSTADAVVRKMSEVSEFKRLTKRDAQVLMLNEIDKLIATCPPGEKEHVEEEMARFQRLYTRFLQSSKPVEWDRISALPAEAIQEYAALPCPPDDQIRNMLSKLVVVKLNGGLGTSMGCQGPKSAIPVRNDLTFLDLAVQQIEHLNKTYGCKVPLVLMNSFNTDEDTTQILRKYKGFNLNIYTFTQSRFPRINRDTLMPLAKSLTDKENGEAFYPPGHGDFYESFCQSGLLKHFLQEGCEYVFISNVDNLGATVDLNILSFLLSASEKPGFVMEVTDKTRSDIKGGTLINYDNRIRLLEIAQVPPDHVDEFKSIKKFKIFNTNNLWIQLAEIERIVEEGSLQLEIIVNPKTLANGLNVVQLETAAGAAISHFRSAIGINVPRARFLPVKKTSDLMLAMSNLYTMRNGSLTMSPLRTFPSVPLIKLGDAHFSKVQDFLSRFSSIPDILELDHLTVSGDVTFGKGVVLRGTVIIIANHGEIIDVPPGAILDNKIMSGNLRILTH